MLENIEKYLPSLIFRKRLFVVLGLVVLGIAIFFIYKSKPWQNIPNPFNKKITPSGITVGDIVQSDEDKDGIPDWKEIFLGKNTTIADNDIKNNNTPVESTNKTENFAKDLFSTVASSSQVGQINEDGIKFISDKAYEYINSQEKEPRLNESSLTIKYSTPTDKEKEAYFTRVNNIISSPVVKNDISLLYMDRALKYQNRNELKNITPLRKGYALMATQLKKMETPQIYSLIQLDLVNAYTDLSNSLSKFELAFDDPIQAFGAIKEYPIQLDSLSKAISNYLLIKNK